MSVSSRHMYDSWPSLSSFSATGAQFGLCRLMKRSEAENCPQSARRLTGCYAFTAKRFGMAMPVHLPEENSIAWSESAACRHQIRPLIAGLLTRTDDRMPAVWLLITRFGSRIRLVALELPAYVTVGVLQGRQVSQCDLLSCSNRVVRIMIRNSGAGTWHLTRLFQLAIPNGHGVRDRGNAAGGGRQPP